MKDTIVLLLLSILSSAAAQTIFQQPTNPAPTVTVWFTPNAPNITNNFIFFGVASGVYTNRTAIGTATNLLVTLPDRGIPFFFVATSQDNKGLQSKFSNEVSYTPPAVPSAPTMQPVIVLTVQASPQPQGVYADTDMRWSLSPSAAEQYYRTRINRGFVLSTIGPPMPIR